MAKVEICGTDTSKLVTLTEEEKRELLAKAHGGDAEARERLILGNLRLVLSVMYKVNKFCVIFVCSISRYERIVTVDVIAAGFYAIYSITNGFTHCICVYVHLKIRTIFIRSFFSLEFNSVNIECVCTSLSCYMESNSRFSTKNIRCDLETGRRRFCTTVKFRCIIVIIILTKNRIYLCYSFCIFRIEIRIC